MPNYSLRQSSRNKVQKFKIREIPHLSSPLTISQLNYSYNQIRTIGSHIAAATNLQIIDLSHNKIRKIEHIFLITSLKFVNLSFNLLTEIPNGILSMLELQNLDVSYNKISTLSSITSIKSLVEIRVKYKKGWTQINLEGNQVMRKKSCRQEYQKWMKPYFQQYMPVQKSLQYQNAISMTNKRNSKSLELKQQDISGLQTKRIIDYFHHQQQMHLPKNIQQNDRYCGKKSQKSDICLSPNFVDANTQKCDQLTDSIPNNIISIKSQMIKDKDASQNNGNFYKSQQVVDMGQNGQLDEWFSICLGTLRDLSENFKVIMTSQDIMSVEDVLKQKIIQESVYASQLIAMSQQTIRLTLDHNLPKDLQNEYLTNIVIINDKIKKQHHQILTLFSKSQSLPVRLYKPWVSQFRKLKQLIKIIPQKIVYKQLSFIRQQQINQLINISPDKPIKTIQPMLSIQLQQKSQAFQPQNTQDKNKLSDLLFSKNKEDCMLLSERTISVPSSEKKKQPTNKAGEECEQCLLGRWQLSRLKQQMKELLQKVQVLQRQRTSHLKQIQDLHKFKQKYASIQCKQQLIIEELDNLTPSTYQNILLEQAKAIQFMITSECRGHFGQLPIENSLASTKNDNIASGHTMTVKQSSVLKEATNTRLCSNRNSKADGIQPNMISEFTVHDTKQLLLKQSINFTRGSSYFKNKNIITTVNKADDVSNRTNQGALAGQLDFINKSSNQAKGIVVSQFSSQNNSLSNKKIANATAKSKKINNQQQNSQKPKQNGKLSRIVQDKTQKQSQNDVILLSEGSDLKNINHSKNKQSSYNSKKPTTLSYLKSQQYSKLMNHKSVIEKQCALKQNSSVWSNSMGLKPVVDKSMSLGQFKNSATQQTLKENKNKNGQIKNKEQPLKRAKTADKMLRQFISDYKQHQYIPMQSQEGDRYKRYIRYHLRNNIIEVLSKKSAELNNFNAFSKKLNYLTTSHKLIHKNIQNNNSESQTDKKNTQINKTFR